MSRLLAFDDRLVLNDLNARSESEVIDGIYDRSIITTNSANILNIMAETSAVNPEEEVIRKRGRKKTPKVSQLPLRRSPRKTANPSSNASDTVSVESSSNSDQTHDYFLRTPKKTPQKSSITRTPSKQTPSKSSTSMSIRRASPRKRLQLDGNDSGLGLSPALSGSDLTPIISTSERKSAISKTKTLNKSLSLTRRRKRRFF